jgi:hypothetical protein
MDFAALIPVSAENGEIDRLRSVVSSLMVCEPACCFLVIVHDDYQRTREVRLEVPHSCTVVHISNPRQPNGLGALGGLAVGVLAGLSCVRANRRVGFALKLDTDSLVIGPFADAISNAIQATPNAGILGAVGRTCDRNDPTFGFERNIISPIILAAEWLAEVERRCGDDEARLFESLPRRRDRARVAALKLLRPHIESAVKNGYRTLHYCQGGAYAVSGEMLDRLAASKIFRDAKAWSDIPIGEDVILGMCARSVGLKPVDLSDVGEPFGICWRGLAFPPDTLIRRRHSIVHSLKGNSNSSEGEIRALLSSHARNNYRIDRECR